MGTGAVLAALGCAGEGPSGEPSAEPAPTPIERPISGGTLVGSENGDPAQPYGPVVRIDRNCTATKIKSNRYITAAHCLSKRRTQGTMTNDLDGVSHEIATTINLILPHPSMLLAGDFSADLVNSGLFDVALFDIQEATTYPVLEQPSGQVVSPGTTNLTLVGYGCDTVTQSHEPKKQKGVFSLGSAATDVFNVHYLAESSSLNSCSGDSGGPLVRFLSNKWSIVGVVSGAPYFTRVGTVAEWINDPVSNDFRDGSTGFLMNATVVGTAPSAEVHCASSVANNDVKLNYCDTPDGTFTATNAPNFPGWRLFTSSISKTTFKVVNRNNGLCLTRESDTNATALPCAADTAGLRTRQSQAWAFVDKGVAPTATSTTGAPALRAFSAVNQLSGECLGTTGHSAAIGADVRLFACNGSTDQLWVFTR